MITGAIALTSPSPPRRPRADVHGRRHRVTHLATLKVASLSTREFNEDLPLHRTFTARAKGSGDFSAEAVLRKAYRTYMPKVDAGDVALPGDTTSARDEEADGVRHNHTLGQGDLAVL